MKNIRSLCLALALVLPAGPALAAPLYHLVATVPLGGGEKWDYLKIDAQRHWLYISHGAQETVVSLRSLKIIGELTGLPGSHGITVDPATGNIWADSAGNSNAVEFSPKNFKPLASVPVVLDADGMDYDAASKTIFVSGGDGNALTPINPATAKPYPGIALGGSPESFLADGKGALYVNIIDKNELLRIDTATRKITARWPTTGCLAPTGLALDGAKRLLFVSCRGGSMDVLNADTGVVVASFPIDKGTDSAAYDPVRHRAFSANGVGTLTVVDDSGPPKLLGVVTTEPGARTLAADPVSGDVYTVTATVTCVIPGSGPAGHPHYSFAPGSLKLLVYAPGAAP
jgi:DNA-binding beta-propeller fold protein YncE